ncbi:MAG: pyruvate kinase [Chitinophagales bacterium]|jgi:pyruvate kinase|nr:pyruvate kinase [Chitinophagales bacterium]
MIQDMIEINENKTKIVATYGPSTMDDGVFKEMIIQGVDVFRFNFSHGDYDFHLKGFQQLKDFNKIHKTSIAILADLQGPKIRIGSTIEGGINLIEGQKILLTNQEQISDEHKLFVSYENLSQDVKPNEDILIDDGKLKLRSIKVIDEFTIETQVIEGGLLTSKKGVNFPNTKTTISAITPKDWADFEFAVEHRANWIALSFVRDAKDILEIKNKLAEKNSYIKVIAKLEKPEAIDNLDEIIEVADGVMVARGDLAVEVPLERVPLLQKEIVRKCNQKGKPVIVATQMMESMTDKSFPTRAEISDVANAVIDGADALMLSGETSVGKYPVKVIETMNKIITQIEANSKIIYNQYDLATHESNKDFLSDALCFQCVNLAENINADAIIGMTRSGYTGFRISSFRPKSKVFIFTDNRPLLYTMNLLWGVKCFYYDGFAGTDQTIADVIELLKSYNQVKKNDVVINTASMPFSDRAKTNTIKISIVS